MRWQVRVAHGIEDPGRQLARAWTEAGAWRKARRRWQATPFDRQHFTCGTWLPTGCGDARCDVSGWYLVSRSNDSRPLAQVLTEEAARGR